MNEIHLRTLGVFCLTTLALLHGCGAFDAVSTSGYQPPISFTGYFDDTYLELTGNASHPNSVERIGDTIRMYFYSYDYHNGGNAWHGDQLRIDLYRTNESSTIMGTDNALVRLSRYFDTNATYLVSAADSTHSPPLGSKMTIHRVERRAGGRIDIRDLFAALHTPNCFSVGMEIEDGHILGHFDG
ncbi:MAG: hypothetical protein ACOC41_06050 [Chitinivibrionales bacterium]